MLKAAANTQKQLNLVKLHEQSKKNLEQEIQNYKEEAQKQRKIIYQLEKERDRYINEASDLTQKVCAISSNYVIPNLLAGRMVGLTFKTDILDRDYFGEYGFTFSTFSALLGIGKFMIGFNWRTDIIVLTQL